jgi:hypothetical protein
MCTLFTKKSQHVSANCPISPPLLAIQAARGHPNQSLPSLTVILQGGNSGLSAGPVFRMMACPEHCAFCAHMEPFMSHETDSGRENGRLGPGRLHSRDLWAGGALVCNWEHQATCASAPSGCPPKRSRKLPPQGDCGILADRGCTRPLRMRGAVRSRKHHIHTPLH